MCTTTSVTPGEERCHFNYDSLIKDAAPSNLTQQCTMDIGPGVPVNEPSCYVNEAGKFEKKLKKVFFKTY